MHLLITAELNKEGQRVFNLLLQLGLRQINCVNKKGKEVSWIAEAGAWKQSFHTLEMGCESDKERIVGVILWDKSMMTQ